MPIPNAQPAATAPHGTLVPGADATADFMATLNDPRRWVVKKNVPIFKSHKRTDPATGKLIEVDPVKLYRIAENMQTMERQGGVPIRMTLGHTEPGKPETQQPPVGGYYRNARVQAFGPKGEPAIVVDEWLDPQYAPQRKNFPYRSAEYYDDTEQITGVALLTRDPFLDLGVVAYGRESAPTPYTYAPPGMVQYSNDGRPHAGYRYVLNDASVEYAAPNRYPAPWGQNARTGYADLPLDLDTTPDTHMGSPSMDRARTAVRDDLDGSVGAAPTPRGGFGTNGRIADLGTRLANNKRLPYADPGAHVNPPRYTNSNYSNQGNRMFGRGRPGRYADDGMAAAGASSDPLQTVYTCLSEAVDALSQMMSGPGGGGGPGSPPPGPFPGGPPQGAPSGGGPVGGSGGPDDEEMIPNARYAQYADRPRPAARPAQRPAQRPQNYGEPTMQPRGDRRYARYDRAGDPALAAPPPAARPAGYGQPPARTISGLPVGYALEHDQLKYELRQANEALRVLYYERDQSDTEACAAEIGRLAAVGYNVGEYEVAELKAKPRDQRAAYINHIVTKYQRVGTDAPPPMFGDPTPGAAEPAGNRPLTRDEMDQALKISAGSNDPNAFTEAVRYMRSGGNRPTPYGAPPAAANYGAPPDVAGQAYDVEQRINGMGNPYAGM